MLIQLAIIGLLAALLPIMIVWTSSDANKYRKLAWITLFLTFDLVMFGAFTRLTDSGLGCPDWPGCYGHASPSQAHERISSAQALMPTGPVTVMKAWIEMTHRYLAMGVGVLIVSLMVSAWRMHFKKMKISSNPVPLLPTALFLFVCLQGAFGAWTVTMKLQPVIVTTHLLLAMSLLGMLTWLCKQQTAVTRVEKPFDQSLKFMALVASVLLVIQIALGGWVSTNYATLACTDFPLCQGQIVPQMDFEHGFTLWRKLGETANGDFLPFPALTAIHWVHRNIAFLVFGLLGWVAIRALRINHARKTAQRIAFILILQLATGMSTIFLKWPLLLAVAHNAGAALLVILVVMLNYELNFTSQSRLPSPLMRSSGALLKRNQ